MLGKNKNKSNKKSVAKKAVGKSYLKKKATARKHATSAKGPKGAKTAKPLQRRAGKSAKQAASKAKRVVKPTTSKVGSKKLAKLIEGACRAISLEIMIAALAHDGVSLQMVDGIMLKHKATIVNLLVNNGVITIRKTEPHTNNLSETGVYAAADSRKSVSVLKALPVKTSISAAQ